MQFEKVGEVVRIVAGQLGDPAEPATNGVGVHAQGLRGGGDFNHVDGGQITTITVVFDARPFAAG